MPVSKKALAAVITAKGGRRTSPFQAVYFRQNRWRRRDLVATRTARSTSVRYDAVNAMLLNEFLKEHCKVQEHEATIAQLRSTVAQQQERFQSKLAEQEKRIEALASGLAKVSARLDSTRPGPQVAANNSVKQLRDKYPQTNAVVGANALCRGAWSDSVQRASM